ncbi:hypothetical protein DFH07DRAFT_737700 [Mycena maculata]|uniref:NADAR domain-containing protein n=1 Tax=Mycena maculata TaxID=230809 RepID=A0AAD7JKS7_9AGAR|nr:hypothetical protein DFH07DRAFT_737700 [Mycena maculata]
MPQLTIAQAFARAPKTSDKKSDPIPAPVVPPRPKKTQPVAKILFGPHGQHADFNQFSLHSVGCKGVIYPTSLHLFQAFKFLGHRPDLAEQIRRASTAALAVDIAHANQAHARPDWLSVNIAKMEEALFLKFSQHPLLRQELLSTADAELYQDSVTDSFWGVGPDLLGCNHLGQALERVRESLGGAKAPVHKVLQCQVNKMSETWETS